MTIAERIIYNIVHPSYVLAKLCRKLCPVFPSRESYLKTLFRLETGERLNLKEPKTFNEKIQWLKLYDHNPIYAIMVDKYAVKDYVTSIIGKEHVIQTIGVWNRPDDIEWDKLPNQFVLKTTHGGGSHGVIVCKDKAKLNYNTIKERLQKAMQSNIAKYYCEWPYSQFSHKIIAEQYIKPVDSEDELTDYKWFCFNGVPRFCQVIRNRSTKETIDFFDTNWEHQDFIGLNPEIQHFSDKPIERPKGLNIQIEIAKKLSAGRAFVRVDLYDINGTVLFGETTYYPASGFGTFRPKQYNRIIGDMIKL